MLQSSGASPALEASEAARVEDHTRNPAVMVRVFRHYRQVPEITSGSDVYCPPPHAHVQGKRSFSFIVAIHSLLPRQQKGFSGVSLTSKKVWDMYSLKASDRPQVNS